MFVTDYLLLNKPYEDHSQNLQEFVNECTVLLAAYPLLAFTNWVGSFERQMEAGWVIIGFIAFIIIFNVGFLLVSICMICIYKLKLRFRRK